MNLIFKALAPVALLGVLAATAQAAPPRSHDIHHRLIHQSNRIQQGVSRGQLTPAEAARLRAREAAVARQTARDRASHGHFSHAERRHVQHELNHDSRAINRDDHNRRYR